MTRAFRALAGWPEVPPPPRAWTGQGPLGQPLVLAHTGARGVPPVAGNERGTIRVVLAGSIYNRREIRAGLEGRHALGTDDDAELVAHLYEERGLRCIAPLRGAFSLAIWDERRHRVVLARDHLGLVPLYYSVERGRLGAASRLPALARLPGLGDAWDASALDAFLAFGSVPPPVTPYPAIRQLSPGELLVWDGESARTQRYWQLAYPERRLDAAEAVPLLRMHLTESLRVRQAAAVSGLLLDAAPHGEALLALAAASGRLPAAAYATGGGDARLASRLGVDVVRVDDATNWATVVDDLLANAGAPVGCGAVLGTVAAAVQASGTVGVLLAGLGGREILGGSAPIHAWERVRTFRRLPGLVREGAEIWGRVAPSRWGDRVHDLVEAARLAPLELYARSINVFAPEERAALYTPEWRTMLGSGRPWEVLVGLFAEAAAVGASEMADAIHYVDLRLRLAGQAVALVAAPVDVRLPMADHRLAHLVASVPPAARCTARRGPLLLRSALRGLPLEDAAGAEEPARVPRVGVPLTVCRDILTRDRVAALGAFRPEVVARLWVEHDQRLRDHTERLWALALTSRWLERRVASAPASVRAAG